MSSTDPTTASTGGPSAEGSPQDKLRGALDALGTAATADTAVVFAGERLVLPERMRDNLPAAITYLTDLERAQQDRVHFTRDYPRRPWDGAAAFERAMVGLFGTAGIPRETPGFFGATPPERRTIQVGVGETLQIPWGRIEFSPLEATFHLEAHGEDDTFGFRVHCHAPKRQEARVRTFLDLVEKELAERSIYKGKAFRLVPGEVEPEFLDLSGVDPDRVLYAAEVFRQLAATLWAPIEHTAALRAVGQPLKSTVLLEGPYGTGKSLAGSLTALKAVASGWTYIHLAPGAAIEPALALARQHLPAVVWVEDVDVAAGSDQDRVRIVSVLEALDGVTSKTSGEGLVVGMTTNHAQLLEAAALRPGRIDAVIHVAGPDRFSFEGIIQATIPQPTAGELNYDILHDVLGDLMPAFLVEACGRALRYAISRTGGTSAHITTQDILDAGEILRGQIALMEVAATGGTSAHATLDQRLTALVEKVLERAVPVDSDGDLNYSPFFSFASPVPARVTRTQKHPQ